MRRLALIVVLLCLAPLSWAEPSLRTQAVLLTANALVYFDADPRARPDERHLARMLQAREGLRRQLDERQVLQRLCLNIGELLLHTQARSARVLGDHSLNLDQSGFLSLDRQIEADFAEAIELLPAQTEALHKQRLAYRFVRKRLLDAAVSQVDGSLERYVASVLVSLDVLAADPMLNPLP
ncbi:MAG: hypothetical protein CVV08_08765 [Gammaproteobacteria bacterium HGW-Gammaproteobacteria-12]|nr:MAG: hypothetical protein CVV08_08765 [Gammaproteobacteria bacterium HGW-Gammaproteobacteria-12]